LLGCSGGAPAVEAPVDADTGVEHLRDIAYVPGSTNPKLRLDLMRPAGAHGRPVVVFLHGGYWTSGDRHAPEHGAGLYAQLGLALARRGLVAVVPSYRLAPETDIDGMLDDVARALAWVHREILARGGDPRRVVVMGHSAGGHLAAMLATDDALLAAHGLAPDDVRAYVAMSAIWDVTAMYEAHPERFNEQVTYRVFGRDPEAYPKRSPLVRIGEQRRRPVLIVVGERDFPYLLVQAQAALEALHRAGGEATVRIVRGYDHLDLVRRFGGERDPVIEHVLELVEP
jgi:acetyl esterase/lipase